MFNLWNVSFPEPAVIEFDVSRANMPRLGRGTAPWMAAALQALDLSAHVDGWEVRPTRTHYFSDYLDSEEWRDRWQEAWTVRVNFTNDARQRRGAQHGPFAISALDESAPHATASGPDRADGLVIARLHGDRQLAERLARQLTTIEVSGTRPRISLRDLEGGSQQMRLLFPDLAFPDAVPELEDVLRLLSSNGAVVHWRDATPEQ